MPICQKQAQYILHPTWSSGKQIVKTFADCRMRKDHIVHIGCRYMVVDSHLKEIDYLVGTGTKQRNSQYFTAVMINNCF